MKIANIITSTHYSPAMEAMIERQVRVVRPKRLTYRGAERILRRQAKEDGQEWTGCIVRIECWGVQS